MIVCVCVCARLWVPVCFSEIMTFLFSREVVEAALPSAHVTSVKTMTKVPGAPRNGNGVPPPTFKTPSAQVKPSWPAGGPAGNLTHPDTTPTVFLSLSLQRILWLISLTSCSCFCYWVCPAVKKRLDLYYKLRFTAAFLNRNGRNANHVFYLSKLWELCLLHKYFFLGEECWYRWMLV